MSNTKTLIVTGATGKQGSALIKALLSQEQAIASFTIYALTRNASSPSARRLTTISPQIHLIQGDFSNPTAIFSQVPSPWGLFLVTNPMNAAREEAQGKAMTAAALAAGVKHIVFTATDRGVDSDATPTPVPHFASKYRIEKDLTERCSGANATWTMLRPVAFMENLTPDFLGKVFTSMWRLNGEQSKLQLVSTSDIGRVAAEAFGHAEKDTYRNRSISLAGEEISAAEAAKTFREVTGQEIPATYGFVARTLKVLLHTHLGIMFDWFRTVGFGADVKAVRERYPFMKDFRTWLVEESAWKAANAST